MEGQLLRISPWDTPAATLSTMTDTVTRVPRIQAMPWHTAGFTEILDRQSFITAVYSFEVDEAIVCGKTPASESGSYKRCLRFCSSSCLTILATSWARSRGQIRSASEVSTTTRSLTPMAAMNLLGL